MFKVQMRKKKNIKRTVDPAQYLPDKDKRIWVTCWQGLYTIRHHFQVLNTIKLFVCLFIFMWMHVCLSVYVYAKCMWYLKRPGEGDRFPWYYSYRCETLGGRWELNICLLQELKVFLTARPSLHPQQVLLMSSSCCTMDSPITDFLMIK